MKHFKENLLLVSFIAFGNAFACDIPFKAVITDPSTNGKYHIDCGGPYGRTGSSNGLSGTTQFYCADITFLSPYSPPSWNCNVATVDTDLPTDSVEFYLKGGKSVTFSIDTNGCIRKIDGDVSNVKHYTDYQPCE